MGLVELNVKSRNTTGKNANRRTRASGEIPAVLYGRQRETSNVALDTHEFTRALTLLAGRSAIFSLQREGVADEEIALLREVQQHPVTDQIMHVDLFEIPRGVPITVAVSIQLEGESLSVKRGDANIAQVMDYVELSCLPRELPEYIPVDITDLETNDKVYVKDLEVPVGEIVSDPEALVINLKAPAIYVEEEEEEEEVLEGEEGAEGAAEGGEPAADGGDQPPAE